ncbi:hypothetical protein PAXRUDRAFT_158890 [Paxillus rubicundulus Ve08.2h10]|uniref:C2H2-type domain-containing protein n=1 Tax=Paxillus rubicundulus Ve08.2h10 TaxID=930991 RepID=A0A0D0CXQ4_9AGAM|nr:hypothetical protein PAXRUDRAFT_158890 [Paxillus rubicundulus Ve08.2h10]
MHPTQPVHTLLSYTFPKPTCRHWFKNKSGLTQHVNTAHAISPPPPSPLPELHAETAPDPTAGQACLGADALLQHEYEVDTEFFRPRDKLYWNYHMLLTGQPCDKNGDNLSDGTLSHLLHEKSNDNWEPYQNWLEFELAEFLYTQNQMPALQIDTLLDIWAASLLNSGGEPLFTDHKDLYKMINSTALGDIKWDSFAIQCTSDTLSENVPAWMNDVYDVYF